MRIANTTLHFSDLDRVQRSLEGDAAAIGELQAEFSPYLRNLLFKHQATETEIEDVLAGLWADCLVGSPDKPPLLTRYHGGSALHSWLAAVTANRWISLKRREAVHSRALQVSLANGREPAHEPSAGRGLDTEIMATVEKAVRQAMATCDAEELVLLQLVHLHQLTRRELADLLGLHESNLSRRLKATEKKIAESTLKAVRATDPLLDLAWEDFLLLCESTTLFRN